MVAVISVDAYHFMAFSDMTCHLQDTRMGVFWLKLVSAIFTKFLFFSPHDSSLKTMKNVFCFI